MYISSSNLNNVARMSAPPIAELASASLAKSTRHAYAQDIQRFRSWGGRIPCTPKLVARYAAALSVNCAFATISRRLNAIRHGHAAIDARSPTHHPLVRDVLKGIARRNGTSQRQAAPLTKQLLRRVLRQMTRRSVADVRDRALLLLGFTGAFRRSELTAIDIDDLRFSRRGLVVTIRTSKTDQISEGQRVAIPSSCTDLCAVAAVRKLLACRATTSSALFQRMHRSGVLLSKRLDAASVSTIIKRRLTAANVDSTSYSGHSLRAGLATEAARNGVPTWKIRQQTRHKSDAMVSRYVRDANLWANNAAARVLR
jgi:integrase